MLILTKQKSISEVARMVRRDERTVRRWKTIYLHK